MGSSVPGTSRISQVLHRLNGAVFGPGPFRFALREAPVALGVLVGSALVLRQGPGWYFPLGVDWQQYIEDAMVLSHPGQGYAFTPWRQPLYPLLVALLGEDQGYVHAAQYLAVGSAATLVVASALLARALGSPLTGALAAITAGCIGSVSMAARLVTPYPVFGALFGLSLAFGACCARWPWWPTAFLTGLFAAATWATDLKGIQIIPLAILLVATGVLRSPRPRWRRGLAMAVGLALGLAIPCVVDREMKQRLGHEPIPLSAQIESQRQQHLDQLSNPVIFGDEVRTACTGASSEISIPALFSPCGVAMLRHNLRQLQHHKAVPDIFTLLLVLLCLIPAAWGTRGRDRLASSCASFLTLVVPLAAGAVGLLWVSSGVRYIIHLAVPTAALVPVGFARLMSCPSRWWSRLAPWTAVIALGGAAAWLLAVWPQLDVRKLGHPRTPPPPLHGPWQDAKPDPRMRLISWLAGRIGPEDKVIDCAEFSFEVMVMPKRIDVVKTLPHDNHRCASLIRNPPEVSGDLWLFTRHLGGRRGILFNLPPEFPKRAGWEEVWRIPERPHNNPWPGCCDHLRLWRRGVQSGQLDVQKKPE